MTDILNLIVIIAMSVDVERLFSKGCLLLSHICNCLSVQSTRALTTMCLAVWRRLGHVKDKDVLPVTMLPDLEDGEQEEGSVDGWDAIVV